MGLSGQRGKGTVHGDRRIDTLFATVSELSWCRRIQQFLSIISIELRERSHANADFGQARRSLAKKPKSSEPRRRDIVLRELTKRSINSILVLQRRNQRNMPDGATQKTKKKKYVRDVDIVARQKTGYWIMEKRSETPRRKKDPRHHVGTPC